LLGVGGRNLGATAESLEVVHPGIMHDRRARRDDWRSRTKCGLLNTVSHSNHRTLVGGLLVGAVTLAIVACGGAVSSVPNAESDAGGGGGGGATDAAPGPRPPGEDGGGKPDAPGPTDGAVSVCKADQDCNGDPQVSSLEGYCYEGICICREGLHVQPNGKCSKTPVPPCMSSSGKCFQEPANCPSGFVEGSQDADFTCGDLIPAVCCFASTSCQGPAFNCCSPVGGTRAQICESGYRTCPAQYAPIAPGTGCK
jgi:hypothetical protein